MENNPCGRKAYFAVALGEHGASTVLDKEHDPAKDFL
jgi:hypothetical protein